MNDLRPQDAARLVWSYAVLGYRPASFLDRVSVRATVRAGSHTQPMQRNIRRLFQPV